MASRCPPRGPAGVSYRPESPAHVRGQQQVLKPEPSRRERVRTRSGGDASGTRDREQDGPRPESFPSVCDRRLSGKGSPARRRAGRASPDPREAAELGPAVGSSAQSRAAFRA